MNVKEKIKASSKKIIAGTVAAVTLASSLPLQAFAEEVIMPIANGDAKYTLWGDSLAPSDGSAISNENYYYLDFTEDADGHKMLHEGSHNANRLLVADSPDADSGVLGVCVGCGLEFKGDGSIKYTERTASSSDYWNNGIKAAGNLPKNVWSADDIRNLIGLAMYFGYDGKYYDNPNTVEKYKKSGITGASIDDWLIATQVLVWEFQQSLRMGTKGQAWDDGTDINSSVVDGLGIQAPSHWLQQRLGTINSGTRRVKIFNYLLETMEDYRRVPSFSQEDSAYHALPKNSSSLATVTMKWDASKNKYIGTIEDSNGTSHAAEIKNLSNDYNISVSASTRGTGNISVTTYTFSCDKATGDKIGNSKILMGKTPGLSSLKIYESSAKWTSDDGKKHEYQPMAEGSYDYVEYYVNVKVEKHNEIGSFRIVKEFDGGTPTTEEIESVAFKVKDKTSGKYIIASAQATTGAGRGIYTYTGTSDTGTTFRINGSSLAFKISNLPIGTYTVTETSNLSKWKEGSAVNVTVTVNGTAEKTYTNTREKGSLRVEKQFSGGTPTIDEIKDVEFIVKTGDDKNYVIATKDVPDSTTWGGTYTYSKLTSNRDAATRFHITGNTHAFSISNMPTGTYDIWETAHPSSWTPQSDNPIQDVSVTNDEPKEVEFENDKDGGTGAVMKLFSGGSVTAEEYAACKFTLKASDGKYVRATAQQNNNLGGFYTFSSFSTTAQEFSLHTYAHVVSISDLPVGTYTFTETKSPDGWTAEPSSVKVVVTKDETSTANITNTKDTASLHVTKRFVGDNAEMIPAGAERTHLLFRFICFPIRKIAYF